jgi:hypothetical protein
VDETKDETNPWMKLSEIVSADETTDESSFDLSFQLGPDLLLLNDLEHGVLRGNQRAPHSIAPLFSRKDPRIALSMPKVDYRIHFALNCGATRQGVYGG